ncbi:hypothetical protein PCC9214_01763 [Planktothrix tepida]|uniref:Uncharacterized protein n=2 Tax=Planktothrix TaxID=54304 RepID=A0A1J1LMP1_9CYAN|nr:MULTISPECIES: hypothetical protein [Planktothrix]CAD5938503.1 hypothetical protein PCC9214_01763 [Planktothrix tepida]CAD5973233.1 hypothetical protein NO713_03974 [Planktothrix pseudagardhii]CUR33274.1 conserved hypothetical protein [Planktothrix tepida PCC 9214]
MADLSGIWLGTYWQQGVPTRFEVTFIQSGNTLAGNILDEGYLGEAQISGTVVGRGVSFTKQYLTTSPDLVSYTGTVSEDENYLQGQWQISRLSSGAWEAYRSEDNLTLELNNKIAQKVPVVS